MADVHSNGAPTVEALKNNAAAAYTNITNGPVAQNVKDQSAKTTAEFNDLANSRQTPDYKAATGQPLTPYHSLFTQLLSWKNPRATGIAYAATVMFIFAFRYLDLVRYGLKLTWMALGVTIAAEVAGKLVLNNGLTTQFRPRKYYTVPQHKLEAFMGDVTDIINFFVIESQRILFAENVWASVAAALAAFISYYLVKIVPYWGLALIATSVVFLAPLIYSTNQELIDGQLAHAGEIINDQTHQLRNLVAKNTEQATQVTKEYLGDYTAKAQSLIKNATGAEHNGHANGHTNGHANGHANGHTNGHANGHANGNGHKANLSTLKDTDFPPAPREDIKHPIVPVSNAEQEPLILA
ncbi:Reticulon-domain-containing protein [Cladorrhinum samala]|uniref:Reticulon-like protein n=1 Tax=Cladorrhinum samala TaxID=585594 RepID=A0AAV9HPE3_9PEZI|nr:Reticulon-domain-containing protein [Cladorrhinum samala]